MGSYLVCGERENNSKTVSNIMADFITEKVGPPNDTSGNGWALRVEDFANLIIELSSHISSLAWSIDSQQDDPSETIDILREIGTVFSLALADMIVREERYTYVRWE